MYAIECQVPVRHACDIFTEEDARVDYQGFGKRLREEREKRGLSREQAAPIAGVSVDTLGRWERAESDKEGPPLKAVAALAEGWGISLDWLAFGDASRAVKDSTEWTLIQTFRDTDPNDHWVILSTAEAARERAAAQARPQKEAS